MAIYSYFSANGVRTKELSFRSEAFMEEFLYENPSVLTLEGFGDVTILHTQVPWKRDKRSGRIDLLATYGADYLAIIELKKGKLCQIGVDQLKSYFKNDWHLKNQKKIFKDDNVKFNSDWCGVLVGSDIEPSLLLAVLGEGLKTENEYPLGVVIIKRFQDNEQVFIHTTSYLPTFKKPQPRFEFNGKKDYKTSQLAHAMIKKYVYDNYDKLSFSDIDRLLGNFKPKKPLIKFLDSEEKGDLVGNYYIKPDQIISLKDMSRFVVLSWWYLDEITTIRDIGRVLGFSFKQLK